MSENSINKVSFENQNSSNSITLNSNQECVNSIPSSMPSSSLTSLKKCSPENGLNSILKSPSSQVFIKNKSKHRLICKSPLKTSPVKSFSHILRKRRKPKAKGLSPRKLKFILPKITKFSLRKGKQLRAIKSKSLPTIQKDFSILHQNQNSEQVSFLGLPRKIKNVIPEGICHQNSSLDLNSTNEPGKCLEDHSRSDSGILTESSSAADEFNDEENEEEEAEDIDQQQQEEYLAALLKASSTIASQKSSERKTTSSSSEEQKLSKQQRRLQERISALIYTPNLVSHQDVLVVNYLTEVRDALANVDAAKFEEFLAVLNSVSPSFSVEDAYFKVVEILNGFPNLQEGFLMFLRPDQAARVGKYSEYKIIQSMRAFADELKHHLSRQPYNMQKTIKALQAAGLQSDIDSEQLLAPLKSILKMQPWLLERLSSCITSSKPQCSLPDDFEDINLDGSFSTDEFETINLLEDDAKGTSEKCLCDCHSSVTQQMPSASLPVSKTEHCLSCALKFIDGRVFLQFGKTLRPAKVTFVKRGEESTPPLIQKGKGDAPTGQKKEQPRQPQTVLPKKMVPKGFETSEGDKPRKGRKSKKS